MSCRTASLVLSLVIASVPSCAFAATFCVGTSQELEDALTDAAANSADDEIRIRVGNYLAVGDFVYQPASSVGDDLTISGGWGTGCLRYSGSAHLTTLDGVGSFGPVLLLISSGGRITVRNLEIAGAFSSDPSLGALHISHAFGSGPMVTIERVIFRDNQAFASLVVATGSELRLLGSLFHSNVAIAGGAGAYLIQQGGGTTHVLANTFANNGRTPAGGLGGLRLNNLAQTPPTHLVDNIFWGNEFLDVEVQGHVDDFSFNDYGVRYGSYSGDSNLQVDPEFEDPAGLDFGLALGSPMVDSGTEGAQYLPIFDLRGALRPQAGLYDRGALERRPLVFADGFESGNTAGWSATVP